MKTRCLFLLCVLLSLLGCRETSRNEVTITGHLSPEMGLNGTTIYCFSSFKNRLEILDSCRIEDNRFRMEVKMPPEWELAPLSLVSENKKKYDLFLTPGEEIVVYLDPETTQFPYVEGAIGSSEWHDYQQRVTDEIKTMVSPLRDRLAKMIPGQDDYQKLQDSIQNLNRTLSYHRMAEFHKNARHPYNKFIMIKHFTYTLEDANPDTALLRELGYDPSSGNLIDSLYNEFEKEFPGVDARNRFSGEKLPLSAANRYAAKKYDELLKHSNTPSSRQQRTKPDMTAYKMGDIVGDFTLEAPSGAPVSLSQIASPYILLDFWAVWCGPCKREIPHLKSAVEKYRNQLTVWALSMDETPEHWKKGIENLVIGEFTHGYVGYDSPQSDTIKAQFGITAIPANFLLDKDRRIIATNLRGEALERKIEELLGQ